jgi:mannose-6-phosphate isomerase
LEDDGNFQIFKFSNLQIFLLPLLLKKIVAMNLYPLKFRTIYKEMVWGGSRLHTALHKDVEADKKVGESWELSGVQGNLSVVTNGFLAGNNIEELAEVYLGELMGDKVYEKFGVEFPLLVKFIDANEALSVQVHPGDELAAQRHHAYGKTEMWYVLDAEPDAELIVGFNRDADLNALLAHVESSTLAEILNAEKVRAGDAFFIPAGTIHAIGKGMLIAEIQQTSDITYRVYDWGRNLPSRPLHIELAKDVIDFRAANDSKIVPRHAPNEPVELVSCAYFTTNLLQLDKPVLRSYTDFDSFVIYVCTQGSAIVSCAGQSEKIVRGETMLIPAIIADEVNIEPNGGAEVLEVYVR